MPHSSMKIKRGCTNTGSTSPIFIDKLSLHITVFYEQQKGVAIMIGFSDGYSKVYPPFHTSSANSFNQPRYTPLISAHFIFSIPLHTTSTSNTSSPPK
mmetsp:Transcript_17498/g.36715  ORF Transcript_17498/g.36715 Transcript_17498/m.36715 type:complete len:98 (+) Transcript_17498:63-356(+)